MLLSHVLFTFPWPSLLTSCLGSTSEHVPVHGALRAFLLLLEPSRCRLRLKQITDQRRVEEASVGIFLHQDVDHLLGFLKTRQAGAVHLFPCFLSCQCIQIDLQLQRMTREKLFSAFHFQGSKTGTLPLCSWNTHISIFLVKYYLTLFNYFFRCICYNILLIYLSGSGCQVGWSRSLVLFTGDPEVHVLLAELWPQETGEYLTTSCGWDKTELGSGFYSKEYKNEHIVTFLWCKCFY